MQANKKNNTQVNNKIKYSSLRVIDENGTMLGILPLEAALLKAEAVGLDLVLVSDQVNNPVARIMDYGKRLYEQSKNERESRKNQKIIEVKEVGLKLTTEAHDLGFKLRNACRFLKNGNRVKVNIRFRGREMAYTNQGYAVMADFAEKCEEFGVIDRPAKMEGRNMVMYLAAKKEK